MPLGFISSEWRIACRHPPYGLGQKFIGGIGMAEAGGSRILPKACHGAHVKYLDGISILFDPEQPRADQLGFARGAHSSGAGFRRQPFDR